MTPNLPALVEAPAPPEIRANELDRKLVETWIASSQSPNTRDNYARQARRLLAFIGKPLGQIRLDDLQAYIASLHRLSPASRANATAAVKSLLSFGFKLGYIAVNPGAVLKAPPVKNTLAERIMSEADTMRMIALEPDLRNRALLTLAYGAGLRASEVTALRWRDLSGRKGAGQVTVFGKGGKTRAILLSANTWKVLNAIRGTAGADDAVFPSRKAGEPLSRAQLHRIVKAAAARAGLPDEVSTHWLRHAHASHTLDRGAPIHLVQATLGHASVATTGRYTHARPTDSSARYLGV